MAGRLSTIRCTSPRVKYHLDQVSQTKLFRIRLHEYLLADIVTGMTPEVVP
jgi:hypothetical protein